eukprot:4669110-Pleurochrysis_carterae.AAC.1
MAGDIAAAQYKYAHRGAQRDKTTSLRELSPLKENVGLIAAARHFHDVILMLIGGFQCVPLADCAHS